MQRREAGEKRLVSASRRTCMGRSGSPTRRTICSEGRRETRCSHHGQGQATERPEREERPPDKEQARWTQQTCESDEAPKSDEPQAGAQR